MDLLSAGSCIPLLVTVTIRTSGHSASSAWVAQRFPFPHNDFVAIHLLIEHTDIFSILSKAPWATALLPSGGPMVCYMYHIGVQATAPQQFSRLHSSSCGAED